MYENTAPRLTQKPSYDMGWQTVDERDEAGLLSEEETDDEPGLGDDLDDEDEEEKEEERTAAILVAEEGRGLIVRGDGIPLLQLQVEPGTNQLNTNELTSLTRFWTRHYASTGRFIKYSERDANFPGKYPTSNL
jgi:hypothetical protein